ncbi:DUF5126 domain-containing protein [Limibacterium fermenti]|mgnify:CR=1 FL=1|uniref:DUF5126 domain-containing protein n=1 Tax=Limibacterium fermenti TaxID=3229863 RepID=UPI003A619B8E
MNKYIHSFLIAMISSLLMVACVDSYMGVEQVKTNSVKPEKITIKEIIPKSGALEIYFTLPKGNPNITQVVASYVNKQGEKVEFTVSRYSAFILVEGLTGTEQVTVELVCIDSSGNKSDVTVVKAAPLTSPIELALNTMKVQPAFGGIKVEWKNERANPFIIHVLVEDSLQKGVVSFMEDPYKTIYTTDSVNTFAYIRQYPSVEKKFGFSVSDKWGNRTDTLISFLTPYKEEEIDYSHIKAVTFYNPTIYAGSRDYGIYGVNPTTGIQNDGNAHGTAHVPQTIFNNIRTGNQFYGYKFVKNLSDSDPANRIIVHNYYLTFDMNMNVRLSRVLIYPRTGLVYTYKRSSPKRFRIWGTNDANNERWKKFPETWTLIGEYVGKDPVDTDNLTPEEIEYFNNNQEYSISEGNVNPDAHPTESFRYMRLQLMETYNKNEAFYTINEFQMYGEVLEYY